MGAEMDYTISLSYIPCQSGYVHEVSVICVSIMFIVHFVDRYVKFVSHVHDLARMTYIQRNTLNLMYECAMHTHMITQCHVYASVMQSLIHQAHVYHNRIAPTYIRISACAYAYPS